MLSRPSDHRNSVGQHPRLLACDDVSELTRCLTTRPVYGVSYLSYTAPRSAEITRDRPGSLSKTTPQRLYIDVLQAATPYELGDAGSTTFSFNLYPVYVREEAFLAAKQGALASAEFQKIIDWRGVVINEPIGALAHLGLARAYVLQGDTVRARAAYQDFLALWKDVDPEIPILNEATAEYDKLK